MEKDNFKKFRYDTLKEARPDYHQKNYPALF